MTASRYILLEGHFESRVLGAFDLIRGFANLKDLAEVSVAYEMEEGGGVGPIRGQQRQIDPAHAERIRRYLEDGDQRFLPEVILSVRTNLSIEIDRELKSIGVVTDGDDGIRIRRVSKSPKRRLHQIRIDRRQLETIHAHRLIRRVDGNHRLANAAVLTDDERLPTKYLAPFCLLLLGPPDEPADDYSESLIFHTINSTALNLESEHALRLILGQPADHDMSPEREFAFNPELHFTRLLRDGFLRLPQPARARLGDRPLSSLRSAARSVLEQDASVALGLEDLRSYSDKLIAALSDIVTRLQPDQAALCQAEFFIELATRAWKEQAHIEDHNQRVNATVAFLLQLAGWLGTDRLLGLRETAPLSKQLFDIYKAVLARVPTRVFLARWYPSTKEGEELKKANLRLKQIKLALREIAEETGHELELIDMGSRKGGTFPIHQKMYEAIAGSDIIVVDLTGARPNVCVEAGYALRDHDKNRLVFIFQSSALAKAVPFDLNTFRYEQFSDTAEIPEKIKYHIAEILAGSAIGK